MNKQLYLPQVKLVEVGLRDGLQNENFLINTNHKLNILDKLANSGLKYIELTAIVSAKWTPSLFDHKEILNLYKKKNALHIKSLFQIS